jgi:putative membrane protein
MFSNFLPWMGLGWGVMILISLGFLALLGIGGYYVITWLMQSTTSTSRSSSRGIDILQERYARGEITREQFIQLKRDLN